MVCEEIAHTTPHGAIVDKQQSTKLKIYSLDAIISVGYRVNSQKATRFMQWATRVLKELMTKGFVLDDKRLKQGEAVFARIISKSFWNVCTPSVQVSDGFGSR